MIRIEGLNKYYNRRKRNENHVLRNLSLELPGRGLVAIFGRSGCGKTTLLSVIGGMDKASDGRVTYLGRDTVQEYDRYRSETVGYIFQSYLLQSGETVFENVAAALSLIGITDKETVERRVTAALAAVGMEHYRDRMPGTLSGGQQQRVAIARAIVKNPPILLADEPTGNLDEANTVAIMELLRAISREHLVLLVTHEEELVARYADRVITLSDGEITSDSENLGASLDAPEDHRRIYLGDLPKESQSIGGVTLCRYGEGGGEISLTLVTKGGETYLRIDSGRVHVLDEASEICLVDGRYEAQKNEKREAAAMNMADLPRISGKHFGRLYGWRSSILGALRSVFGRHRRRDRALRLALAFFAFAAVFLTAIFGTAIGSRLALEEGYSHHTVYVYTPNFATAQKLLSEQAKTEGTIESLRLIDRSYVMGDEYYYFRPHAFETYRDYDYYGIPTNAVLLPQALSDELTLVCGRRPTLAENEILVTTAAADNLLSQSTAGYLRDYASMLGMALTSLPSASDLPRVVGVVASGERAIYLSDVALARLTWESLRERVSPASDYGYTVEEGEVILASVSETPPTVGSTLTLRGERLTFRGRVAVPLGLPHDRYLLSDADYARIACRVGNSSACFFDHHDRGDALSSSTDLRIEPSTWYTWYSVLHVKDLGKARAYLTEQLGEDPRAPDEYSPAILYPEDVRTLRLEDMNAELLLGGIWLAVSLALLSLSVSLLMRSTLFSRVREIGILRAIGVSKRNLLFRFAVESAVLASLTVLPGFLLASAFIALCLSVAPLTASIFFYPVWLALPLLLLLLGVSVFFGVLPLRRLVSPPPSKILAKYDV